LPEVVVSVTIKENDSELDGRQLTSHTPVGRCVLLSSPPGTEQVVEAGGAAVRSVN
jgi:hypothetical protein